MSKVTIGIDPGLGGAIAVYKHDKKEMFAYQMPIYTKVVNGKKRNFLDYYKIKDIFLAYAYNRDIACVWIEEQRPYQQGVTSAFKSGQGFGFLEGLCVGMGVKIEIITPQTWQKLFGISSKKGNTKVLGESIVNNKYSYIQTRTKQGRLLDGIVDSVLICEFGRSTQ